MILDVTQGSPEWLELKYTHIGGSYAASIMEFQKHKTWAQLWQKMTFKEPHDEPNIAMERGKFYEPVARNIFADRRKIKLITPVVKSVKNPILIASLDGCTYENGAFKNVIEIKCYGMEKHIASLKNNLVPVDAWVQCQHIMYVLDIQEMHYISFYPEMPSVEQYHEILVERSDDYLEIYLSKVAKFVNYLNTFTQPDPTDRDFDDYSKNPDWRILEEYYESLLIKQKQIESDLEDTRNQLIKLANNRSVQGDKIRLTRVHTKGRVIYQNIPELKNVNTDQYRSLSTITHRLTLRKNHDSTNY